MKWQPIETAPKDDTKIQLGWWKHTANNDGLRWVIVVDDATDLESFVSHWKPLPEPPETT
jgi:hypothetical protein